MKELTGRYLSRREISRRELSGKEMPEWESSRGKCPGRYFLGWKMPGGELPGRELSLWGRFPEGGAELSVGKSPGEKLPRTTIEIDIK